MRLLLIITFSIVSQALMAQFKGTYYVENEGDTIEYYQFHSDGNYLMERIDAKVFIIEFYFNLEKIEGDEHIMLTKMTNSDQDDFLSGEEGESLEFYTNASLEDLSTYGITENENFKSYRDTLGFDLVKINKNNTINRIYYDLMDTEKKIIGFPLRSTEFIPLPRSIKFQTGEGEEMNVKLLELNSTDEKVLIPKDEELGKYIEFEQLKAMWSMGGFGQN